MHCRGRVFFLALGYRGGSGRAPNVLYVTLPLFPQRGTHLLLRLRNAHPNTGVRMGWQPSQQL
jgi:hypothetical protein